MPLRSLKVQVLPSLVGVRDFLGEVGHDLEAFFADTLLEHSPGRHRCPGRAASIAACNDLRIDACRRHPPPPGASCRRGVPAPLQVRPKLAAMQGPGGDAEPLNLFHR